MRFCKLLLTIGLLFSIGETSSAGFLFNIIPSQPSYTTDGVTPATGSFDVVLNLTGADLATPPTNVAAFNFAYLAPAGLNISGSTAIGTGSGGLINGSVADLSTYPGVLNYGKDQNTGSTAFNNAILARFSFSTLVAGTYNIVPGTAAFQQLTFTGANFVNPTAFGRSITITAVPEPSSMVLAGLAIVGAAGFKRRFRKKASV